MKDKMSLLIGAASLALVSRKRTEGNRNTSAEAYISDWLDNYLVLARQDIRGWNVGIDDWSYVDMMKDDYLVELCFNQRPQHLQSMTFEAFDPIFEKVFNTKMLNQESVASYISIWLDNLLLNYRMTFDPTMDPMLAQQLNDPIRMQELTKARAQSFKDGVLSFATMNRNVLVKECYDDLRTKMNLANFTAIFNKVLDQKILQEATQ